MRCVLSAWNSNGLLTRMNLNLSELAAAFVRMRSLGVEGIVIHPDPVFLSNPAPFAELALAHKLPSAGDDRSFAYAEA